MNDFVYPRFIDFEASGLSEESYPIEVAWNTPEGAVESYLINADCIAEWTYWDPSAERDAHHISQDHLERLGDPPSVVAKRMNRALEGQTLYADAPEFDNFWLYRLFDAVNLQPTFTIGSAIELFDQIIVKDDEQEAFNPLSIHNRFTEVMETYGKKAWENTGFRPHRASHDVQHLMETYRLLKGAGGFIPKT